MNPLAILQTLRAYKGFVLGSIKRDFQSTYRNSILGAAWKILNPLAMIVVYTVIFSQVMKARLAGSEGQYAYSIYLCAGIITWGLFTEIISRCLNMFIDNANLIKKISFPRLCLPLIILGSAWLNFLIIFGLFTLFLLMTGNFPGITFTALIPVLVIETLMAIGLGVTLGILNVFFRDTGHFFNIFLQFWFWLTPIVYPANILPDGIKPFAHLNPMYTVVAAYQKILVNNVWPDFSSLIMPTIVAILLCLLGMRMFRKHALDLADEL